MWSGSAHIGRGWAVYRGPAGDQHAHAHVTVQIALSESGDVAIELGDEVIYGEALIVSPMVLHRLRPSERPLTLLYLDPRTALATEAIAAVGRARAGIAPEAIAEWLRVGRADWEVWRSRLDARLASGRRSLDPRLERSLDEAARSPEPGAVQRAADEVGLSSARLRAIAQDQLGAPVSQFLLWRKLELAGREIACGANLADAAAAGGFADQSHLTRTMRRMFGVTPAEAAATLKSSL